MRFFVSHENSGKTAFALSLPGPVNHLSGHWSMKDWKDDARYMVIDDVPWNKFKHYNYPQKKTLLTCNEQITVRILLPTKTMKSS